MPSLGSQKRHLVPWPGKSNTIEPLDHSCARASFKQTLHAGYHPINLYQFQQEIWLARIWTANSCTGHNRTKHWMTIACSKWRII